MLSVCGIMGCRTWHQPTRAAWQRSEVNNASGKDSALWHLVAPYRDSVSESMETVIGQLAVTLSKTAGENTLGNFVADALLFGASTRYEQVDLAVMNRGGYRLQELPAGMITVGKVYELMPFDNLLFCVAVPGNTISSMMSSPNFSQAEWSVSGLNILHGSVLIGGKPFHADSTYYLAISDYLAEGGDNGNSMQNLPRQNAGYLQRDALIDYIKFHAKQGNAIAEPDTNRLNKKQ